MLDIGIELAHDQSVCSAGPGCCHKNIVPNIVKIVSWVGLNLECFIEEIEFEEAGSQLLQRFDLPQLRITQLYCAVNVSSNSFGLEEGASVDGVLVELGL